MDFALIRWRNNQISNLYITNTNSEHASHTNEMQIFTRVSVVVYHIWNFPVQLPKRSAPG